MRRTQELHTERDENDRVIVFSAVGTYHTAPTLDRQVSSWLIDHSSYFVFRWVMVVGGNTTIQDLHAFLQTLFKPWGFGAQYQASRREVRHKVRRLNLHVYDGNRVHFKVRTGA